MNKNARAPQRLPAGVELDVGVASEGDRLPGIPKEYSGWDVYNNEAKKVDTELVNDWRDSLNSLLLFVSILDTKLLPSNSTPIGGNICCRSYSVHHREQEDAGTRPRRNNGRRHDLSDQQPGQWEPYSIFTTTVSTVIVLNYYQLPVFC